MKKTKKSSTKLLQTLTLLGFIILAFVFFYFSNGINIENLLTSRGSIILKQTPKPPPPSEYNGWIAWWDENNGFKSLSESKQVFKSISPLWYRINSEGTLEQIPHYYEDPIKSKLSEQNIKLIPVITNEFDPKRTSLILNNSDLYLPLIESIKTLCLNSNYQGIDIDWEEIDPKDQEAFNTFINRLSGALHQANLVLTVSIHPQTGKNSDRAVAKGYKMDQLAKDADMIKIMAYDFHNAQSSPGAITPFSDLTEVLKYTSKQLPTEKVILGLPTYGYDWEVGSNKAEPVSFTQASARIKQNNGQIKTDSEANSQLGTYKINGKEHVIWFEDEKSMTKMIELARSYGIYQFSFWRIGTEDPSLWEKLH